MAIDDLFNIFKPKDKIEVKVPRVIPKDSGDEIIAPPASRVSQPDIAQSFLNIKEAVDFITPYFKYEYIPVIRKLATVNSSVSLAANSIVELANTGFEIEFPNPLGPEEELKIMNHLKIAFKRWGRNSAGIHGLINKWIYQIYIGGALSTEWVVKPSLDGVDYAALLNPENIRCSWNGKDFEFYQVPKSFIPKGKDFTKVGVLLNRNSFLYYGFFTDEETPIGNPPFLTALDDIQAQLRMLRNIGYVSDQLGLMGFLEFLMNKPLRKDGESDTAYVSRLESLLNNSKSNIRDGLKDGIVTGFKNDHEFNFHSSTKDTGGVAQIFDINHRMVSNGLFSHPQFLGGSVGGSETMINIVFTKMLSQLTNIQMAVSSVLEYGILLELGLAGFKNPEVKVTFKPSTITDALKLEQANEYKIRNLIALYNQGIIGQDYFARKMGLNKPDQKEPRIAEEDPMGTSSKAKEREQDKDTSDRKTRDKNKPQPKRNDTKTKPR